MYSCRLRTSFRLFVVVSPSFCLSLTLHAAHTTQDFICNWVGNQKWVRDMQWPGKEAFNAAPVLPWTPKGGDAPAGTFQATGNLTCVPSLRHPPVLSAPSSRHQLPSLPRHFSPGAETAPREGGLFYFLSEETATTGHPTGSCACSMLDIWCPWTRYEACPGLLAEAWMSTAQNVEVLGSHTFDKRQLTGLGAGGWSTARGGAGHARSFHPARQLRRLRRARHRAHRHPASIRRGGHRRAHAAGQAGGAAQDGRVGEHHLSTVAWRVRRIRLPCTRAQPRDGEWVWAKLVCCIQSIRASAVA